MDPVLFYIKNGLRNEDYDIVGSVDINKWDICLSNSYGFDYKSHSKYKSSLKRVLPNRFQVSYKECGISRVQIKFELPKEECLNIFDSIRNESRVLAFNSKILVVMFVLRHTIKVAVVDSLDNKVIGVENFPKTFCLRECVLSASSNYMILKPEFALNNDFVNYRIYEIKNDCINLLCMVGCMPFIVAFNPAFSESVIAFIASNNYDDTSFLYDVNTKKKIVENSHDLYYYSKAQFSSDGILIAVLGSSHPRFLHFFDSLEILCGNTLNVLQNICIILNSKLYSFDHQITFPTFSRDSKLLAILDKGRIVFYQMPFVNIINLKHICRTFIVRLIGYRYIERLKLPLSLKNYLCFI